MSRMPAIGAILLLSLGACNHNGPNSSYEDFGERINVEGFGHRYAQPDDVLDELVLGIGDIIQVDVANNPEISSTQPVRFGGVVTAPYVGDVEVAGLTTSQAENKLTALLLPFIDPLVIRVTAIEVVSKNVYLFSTDAQGALIAAKFPLTDDLTLIDLIVSGLQGIPEGVDDCNIAIMRGDPRHPKKLIVNVRDMVRNGYTAANIQMRPDDMVWLPPTLWRRISQTLYQVTEPARVLRRSLADVDDLRRFAEDGELDSRRRRY